MDSSPSAAANDCPDETKLDTTDHYGTDCSPSVHSRFAGPSLVVMLIVTRGFSVLFLGGASL